FNSVENQEISRKFVEREVKACFSYEMDAILKAAECGHFESKTELPSWDDIENLYQYVCPECCEGYQNESEAVDCCKSETEPENEPQEIFEWWIISDFLYRKLKEKNEPVLEWGNNYYWGRCTTGQAILLDRVICDICFDMEILQGQKYDWSEN
ncbi:MAG TPA: hypothetical protein VGB37_09300, partial [Candidatus Lokiarchaeia archaeon]